MATQEWTEHIDVIVPGVIYLLKVLCGIIAGGFTILCTVVGYVGRSWAVKIDSQAQHLEKIDKKLDGVIGTMSLCDSCSTAAHEYKRRKTDISGSGSGE